MTEKRKKLKTVKVEAHASVEKNRRSRTIFKCLLCSSNNKTLDSELGILSHLLYAHFVSPDNAVIFGWTKKHDRRYLKQRKVIDWEKAFVLDAERYGKKNPRVGINGFLTEVRLVVVD